MRIMNGEVGLSVDVVGDDTAPPLLLLHGIINSSRSFEWLLPSLTNRFRVLRLDFRGHGSSDRAPGQYQPQHYVDDAVATLETLTDSPAVVIGHSLGGFTAAALAQQRPELVRAMVLIDPPLTTADPERVAEAEHLMQSFRLIRASLPAAQASGMAPEALAGLLGTVPASNGLPSSDVMIPEALLGQAAGLLDCDASVLDPLLSGEVEGVFEPSRGIPVPTHVITADPDRPDCLCRPDQVHTAIANSASVTAHRVVGAGHLVFDEIAHRDEVRTEIERFLATI